MKLFLETAVKQLHKAGKIPLIQFVRTMTFMGLKEAKDFVEEVANSNNITFPNVNWDEKPEYYKAQLQSHIADIDRLRAELQATKTQLREIAQRIEG